MDGRRVSDERVEPQGRGEQVPAYAGEVGGEGAGDEAVVAGAGAQGGRGRERGHCGGHSWWILAFPHAGLGRDGSFQRYVSYGDLPLDVCLGGGRHAVVKYMGLFARSNTNKKS